MDRWETLKTFIFYNLTLSVLNFYAFLSYLVISNLNYYVSLGIFVNVMSIMDDSNSRLLDLIYVRNLYEEEEIRGRIDALKEEIVNEAGAELGQQIVNEAKHSNGLLTVRENRKFEI